jgi:BirA family biotin operon repressor/biotin-[acetyl-CoA-carboxylase] ligase
MTTRDKLLIMLTEGGEGYLSGEEMSHTLGVSRAAVWKHIHALEEDGYIFDHLPGQGYRLTSRPGRLEAALILWEGKRIGGHIVVRDTVDSTNQAVKALAVTGEPEGAAVVSDTQTAGRGRRGRAWVSPPGSGLYMSVLFRPKGWPPVFASRMPLMVAVAAAEAIEAVTGLAPGIKWPNDLLLSGRKLTGILCEADMDPEQIQFIVAGIGINIVRPDPVPEEIRDTAVWLSELGGPVDRNTLARQLLERIEGRYRQMDTPGGWQALLDTWRARSVTLDREVTVTDASGSWQARTLDIDENGGLIVRDNLQKVRTLLAGDVSLRSS